MGCPKLPYRQTAERSNFLGVWKKTGQSESCDNYYAFGLTFNSYSRENSLKNKMMKFQGQEHIDDLDLGWESFKWRNHMSEIGRFFNVDPLAEKYVYNSPYAFSENKVVRHIELEGLEAVDPMGLGFDAHEYGKQVYPANPTPQEKSFFGKVLDKIASILPEGLGGFFVSTSGQALENANTENNRVGVPDEKGLDFSPMMEINTRSENFNFVQMFENQFHVLDNNINKPEENKNTNTEGNKQGNQGDTKQNTQSSDQKSLEADSTVVMKPDTVKNQTVRTATSTQTGESTRKVIKKNINEVPLN